MRNERTRIVAMCAAAGFLVLAGSARAVHDWASDEHWRYSILHNEGKLMGHPENDLIGTVGPRFIYKDGRWYTGDMQRVYRGGQWLTLSEDAARTATIRKHVIEEKTVVERRGPVEG